MNHTQHNALASFIWNIADDVLRDVYVRGKYRDVILPMTVIRRLDALLEPTKEAVLRMKEHLDKAKVASCPLRATSTSPSHSAPSPRSRRTFWPWSKRVRESWRTS